MSIVFASGVVGARETPSAAVLPLMLVTPALFAVNMLMARWAEGAAIPPWFLAFGRWSLACVLLMPWVLPGLRQWWPLIRANGLRLLVLALFGMGLAVGPQYVGARTTSAVNIALVFAACPMFVGLIEALGWRIPLRRTQVLGMFFSLAGVLVVLVRGDLEALAELRFGAGDGWILCAATAWALYTVLGKRFALPPMPVFIRLATLAAGGALALAPFALIESSFGMVPDFSDSRLYVALAVLAVVPSLGAYVCYDRLASVSGPVGASVSMYMVPLYASLAAWPLLGEAPRLYHALGFGLILVGVVVAARRSGNSIR